jgi:hypothetical protein
MPNLYVFCLTNLIGFVGVRRYVAVLKSSNRAARNKKFNHLAPTTPTIFVDELHDRRGGSLDFIIELFQSLQHKYRLICRRYG